MDYRNSLNQLVADRLATRLFDRDASAFAAPSTPAYASVSQRLGWVDAPTAMERHLADLEAFASLARADGLTDVYLLGMGGSSLCAEVLRDVAAPGKMPARFVVLDTTDERAIRTVTEALVPTRSLFVVASKSGSTVEVASLERHFWAVMTEALGAKASGHFVAITDPDTALAERAASSGYRRVFVNPADIGGRFSALSLFGLVPAALMGIDVKALLGSGAAMAGRCRVDEASNPGLALGAFMGAEAAANRDKLTVLLPASLAPFGAWIEQLIAESTGKSGRGVLPIVGEPVGVPADYGTDRSFVAVMTPDDDSIGAAAAALDAAGRSVFRIETSAAGLGGEFFRWEVATAAAGKVLGVNPFDEPNVRGAKEQTQKQLDVRKATGTFRLEPPLAPENGHAIRAHRPAEPAGGVPAASGRYIAILDYLPADPAREATLGPLRSSIRSRTGLATTHGVGPRYLHSTGQYHKGGPNTGTFLLVTAPDASETQVPGADYTFSALKQAQALGDFNALVAAGREVIHWHVEDRTADFAAALEKAARAIR